MPTPPGSDNAPFPNLLIRNLSVLRGDRLVLDSVSFSLDAGEAMLLTGPNGAGKSTLLRTLAGLRSPDGGEILWNGEDVANDRTSHGARVAWQGHQTALKPGLSLRENLSLHAAGKDPAQALAAFNLTELAELPARMLSAGQKQRGALARVLLGNAPLWLLDEPATGLDHASVALLGNVLAAHRAQGGIVIATTHVPLPLPDVITLDLTPSNTQNLQEDALFFMDEDILP